MSNESSSFVQPITVYNFAGGNITVAITATDPQQLFQKIVPGGLYFSPNFQNGQTPQNLSVYEEGPGKPRQFSASLPLPDGSNSVFYVYGVYNGSQQTGIQISTKRPG